MNRIVFLIALLSAAVPAFAAPLRVLAWDEEVAQRKLAIGFGKDLKEVGYMHPAARTAPIKLPADVENLRLVATDRKNDDGTPVAVPLTIKEGIKHPLLLVLPDPKSKAGVRPLILEDDSETFKWGTIRLINATPEPMIFRWEKLSKALPPGWTPVDVEPGGKSRNMEVFLYRKSDVKRPLYSAVWEHQDDMRQLVFVIPGTDPSQGPVSFKFVPENRVDAVKETADGTAPKADGTKPKDQ